MADKFDVQAFRELLVKIMGQKKQVDFAAEIGVTPQHLNRMLHSDQVSRPSIRTLKAIWKASMGSEYFISESELFRSCGYDRVHLDKEYRIAVRTMYNGQVNAVIAAFHAAADGSPVYSTIYDFVNAVRAQLKDLNHLRIVVKSDRECVTEMADRAAHIEVYWDLDDLESIQNVVLQYMVSSRGYVVPHKLCVTQDEIWKILFPKKPMGEYVHAGEPAARLQQKEVKAPVNTQVAEERFLDLLFGNEKRPTRPLSTEGEGFYVSEIDEWRFRRFLKNHQETFCRSDEERKIYQTYVVDQSVSWEDAFKEYLGGLGNSVYPNVAGAIAIIIARETGLSIEGWHESETKPYPNESVVMYPDYTPLMKYATEADKKIQSDEDFYRIVDPYARELLVEIHSVYFVLEVPVE